MDDFKENLQPLSEIQFPGILKGYTRSKEKANNPWETEEDYEYTGSAPLTKKRKQGDPFSTVMADHNETSLGAQPSDILKPFACDENHRTINQTKPHKCPICSKLCTRKNYLANHMKSHNKKGTQKTGMIRLGVPPEENTDESYRCLICFRSFSRLNHLSNHTKWTHDKHPLASNASQKHISVQRKLKLHGTTTLTKERPFECAFCGKSFRKSNERDSHLLIHLGEKPYSCHICEKYRTVQKSNLNKHLRIHLRKSQSKNMDLNGQQTGVEFAAIVGEISQESQNMKINRQVIGEELFAGEKAIESQNLDANGQYIKEKRCKCSSCPKSFRFPALLKIHVRIHTGERPYKCSYCTKAFKQFNALLIHLRIHTGEKPFMCKFCPKRFGDGSGLNHHLKTHPEEKLKNVLAV